VHGDFDRHRTVTEVVGEREGVHELDRCVASDEHNWLVVEGPGCAVIDADIGLAGVAAGRSRPQLDVASNDTAF